MAWPALKPLLLQLTFFACVCGMLAGIYCFGWNKTWSSLDIYSMTPHYADMRPVQLAAHMPPVDNPHAQDIHDPWGRHMNYPAIWVSVSRYLNLDNEFNFNIVITAYIAAFLCCCFVMLRDTGSVFLLITIFSGSSLLAIERGNNDLLMFTLLYLAARSRTLSASFMLILTAAALKLYPAIAISSLLRYHRTALMLTLVTALYFIMTLTDIKHVVAAQPEPYDSLCYGAGIITKAIRNAWPGFAVSANIFIIVCLLPALLLSQTHFFKKRCLSMAPSEKTIRLFMTGASIYVLTFSFFSGSDYRLIFLLLCIPYLLRIPNRWLMYVLFASIFIAQNWTFTDSLLHNGDLTRFISYFAQTLLYIFLAAYLCYEALNLWKNKEFQPFAAQAGQYT